MPFNAGRLLLGFACVASSTALLACTASGSADVHGSLIAKSAIEQSASKQLTARFGDGKYKITCPHDLAAHTGASMACVTTFPDGTKFSGTATVTSVKAGKANWKYTSSAKPVT